MSNNWAFCPECKLHFDLCKCCRCPRPAARAMWRTWLGVLLRAAANYIDPPHDESAWQAVAYNGQGERVEA
jgi:hypothetical protein